MPRGLARAAGLRLGWRSRSAYRRSRRALGPQHHAAAKTPRRPADPEPASSNMSAIRLDGVRAPTAQPAPAKAAILICTPSLRRQVHIRATLPRCCARPSLLPDQRCAGHNGLFPNGRQLVADRARNKLAVALAWRQSELDVPMLCGSMRISAGSQDDVLRLLAHNLALRVPASIQAKLIRSRPWCSSASGVPRATTIRRRSSQSTGFARDSTSAGAGFLLTEAGPCFERLIAAYPRESDRAWLSACLRGRG